MCQNEYLWSKGLRAVIIAIHGRFNSLPKDKIFKVIKLKTFVDDEIDVAQMMISVFDRVEKIIGKEENAGYQQFSPFPTMFSKDFFLGIVKNRTCVVNG